MFRVSTVFQRSTTSIVTLNKTPSIRRLPVRFKTLQVDRLEELYPLTDTVTLEFVQRRTSCTQACTNLVAVEAAGPSGCPGVSFLIAFNFIDYATYKIFLVISTPCLFLLVEALRYKPEGREFVSRWCHWNSSLT